MKSSSLDKSLRRLLRRHGLSIGLVYISSGATLVERIDNEIGIRQVWVFQYAAKHLRQGCPGIYVLEKLFPTWSYLFRICEISVRCC